MIDRELDQQKLEAYVQKVMGNITAGMTTVISAVGDKLGLYQAIHKLHSTTSEELARETSLSERWLREWLRHQACAGLIEYEADSDRFSLSPEAVVVLLDETHPSNFAGGFEGIVSTFGSLPQLAEAFHSGLGLSYDDHGEGCASGIERMTAWSKEYMLVPKILPMVPGIVEKLERGVMVADVGCGAGRALIVMAESFPNSTFVGYDTSEHALARGNNSLSTLGLDNIRFVNPDEEAMPQVGTFDLITTFDVVHDVPYPAELIAAIFDALKADGVWLCEDIKSFPSFKDNLDQNPMATLMYGFSMLVCLSSSMSRPDGAGLGTLGFNEDVARTMTREAGFAQFSRLDYENPMNNFYLIHR